MGLGGWSISEKAFLAIRKLVPKEGVILELGSGEGTKELSKYYNVFSIEDEQKYLKLYHNNYTYAPLIEYKPTREFKTQCRWYDKDKVSSLVESITYDLILVDGPSSSKKRAGFYKYYTLFNNKVPILFDDTHVESNMKMANLIGKISLRNCITFTEQFKFFSVVATNEQIKLLI